MSIVEDADAILVETPSTIIKLSGSETDSYNGPVRSTDADDSSKFAIAIVCVESLR